MRKNKRKELFALLILLVFGLSLGYALLSTNLSIDGTSTIVSSSWDIHFENAEGSRGNIIPTTLPTINAAGDTVSYDVTLAQPGDFYEFTVDAVNDGTLDGMIDSINSTINNQPISNIPNCLEYYVVYDDGLEIEANHLLKAGTSVKYKVYIGYRLDIDEDDLPSTDTTYNISLNINYKQANEDAVEKPYYIYTDDYNAIGWNIKNIEITLFDNYMELINTTNRPFFFRLLIDNNIITDTDLGFVHDNQAYFLKAYMHDTDVYEENLAFIMNFIGMENCAKDYNTYICVKNREGFHISENLLIAEYNGNIVCNSTTLADGGQSFCVD